MLSRCAHPQASTPGFVYLFVYLYLILPGCLRLRNDFKDRMRASLAVGSCALPAPCALLVNDKTQTMLSRRRRWVSTVTRGGTHARGCMGTACPATRGRSCARLLGNWVHCREAVLRFFLTCQAGTERRPCSPRHTADAEQSRTRHRSLTPWPPASPPSLLNRPQIVLLG